MDIKYRINPANTSFKNWLAESSGTKDGAIADLMAKLELSEVPTEGTAVYASLWNSSFPAIGAQIWHRFTDATSTEKIGKFEQGNLYIFATRHNGKLVIWFGSEWEPADDLAAETVETIEWDDYNLDLSDIKDTEELKNALGELLEEVYYSEAKISTNLEKLQSFFDQHQLQLDAALSGNPATSAELLVGLEARYQNYSKLNTIADSARQHPNYPEDKTEWALGDW
jgi:hypothetical protein